MAKGCRTNQEHQATVGALRKVIGKRAGFCCCEWCEGKDGLRVWRLSPWVREAIEIVLSPTP